MDTFKQTKKTEGNLINVILGNNATLPEVGKGATQIHYTDRSPYQVIEVSKDFKTVILEQYNHEGDDSKGPLQMGHQSWKLTPSGYFITVKWRHNAWRREDKVIEFTEEFAKTIGPKSWEDESFADLWDDNGRLKLSPGKTHEVTKYEKINIIFGKMDYYYCWEI